MYGMNVGLPLGDDPQAFWIILLLMILAGLCLLGFFRFKKWM
jgi:Mg2+ and Co2+ transporter CorA